MTSEPENLILHLLRDMRAEMSDMRTELRGEVSDLRGEVSDLRGRMATKEHLNALRADVASDFLLMRKELGEQIVGLRRAVIEYHTSAIGHGVLISELEARVRRIEQHLELPATDAH